MGVEVCRSSVRIAAVGEKMGCGHWTIMSVLAPALFAKNLDSGYPTVKSTRLGGDFANVWRKTQVGSHCNHDCNSCNDSPNRLIYLATLVVAKLLFQSVIHST